MKRILALMGAILLLLCGCAGEAPAETSVATTEAVTTVPTETVPKKKTRDQMHIVISLPDEADPHWQKAGEDLQLLLENLTYQVTLCYSNNDADRQTQLLEQALQTGVDCILLAPVDSVALSHFCDTAFEQGVPVVTYERPVLYTEGVRYHVSYDYAAMGREMGAYIVQQTSPDTAETPLTAEFFMGAPEDNNAIDLYTGILEVLTPYLEAGTLTVRSGRINFEDVCTLDPDAEAVEKAFRSYLQEHYSNSRPDILITGSDDFADACIRVLDERKRELPLITGIGGTEAGIANTEQGKQHFTVTMDLELLDEKCVELVDAFLNQKEPETNSDGFYNSAVTIPAYFCNYCVVQSPSGETTDAPA